MSVPDVTGAANWIIHIMQPVSKTRKAKDVGNGSMNSESAVSCNWGAVLLLHLDALPLYKYGLVVDQILAANPSTICLSKFGIFQYNYRHFSWHSKK